MNPMAYTTLYSTGTMRLGRQRRLSFSKGLVGVVFLFQIWLMEAAPSKPTIVWEHQIEGAGALNGTRIRRGNGVVAAKNGKSLWLTTDDGSLHILSIDQQDPSSIHNEQKFHPQVIKGRVTECRSSISLYESSTGGVVFGVYAVIDMPESSDELITSRIITLFPDGTQRWEAEIDGIAVGTPQIGFDGDNIFITHNAKSRVSGKMTKGKLSVLRNDMFGIGDEIPLQKAGGFGYVDKEAPFAPLAVYSNGVKDIVYWAEAWENGQAPYGLTYTFDSNSFKVSALTRTTWSTIVAPTISLDGESMWLGGQMSSVHGWTDGYGSKNKPNWTRTLENVNLSQETISNKVTVSSDNALLYVNSESVSFCLDAGNGKTIWKQEMDSKSFPEARLTLDDEFLYTIQQTNGLLTKYDAHTGRLLALFSCRDISGDKFCQDSVEAEFAISPDGSYIYYSNIYGHVVALEFGIDIIEPTISPSEVPTAEATSMPSPVPSASSSFLPTIVSSEKPTSFPTNTPSSEPSSLASSKLSLRPSVYAYNPPSTSPSVVASGMPSISASGIPTSETSDNPSLEPSLHHSQQPSSKLSILPTDTPVIVEKTGASKFDFLHVDFDELMASDEDNFVHVDFDELMTSDGDEDKSEDDEVVEKSSSSKVFSYIAVSISTMVFGLVLGVLYERMWKIRRTESLQLPWSRVNESCGASRSYKTYEGRPLEEVTSFLNQH